MKPPLHVWPQETVRTTDTVTISAQLEWGDQMHNLWYRVPQADASALSPNCDPFVVATVLLAMGKASQLIIHGEVSPSLLRNLEEFQVAWASWLPQLSVVPMVVDIEREPIIHRAEPVAISAFSGGVDSSYTVFRHATGQIGRRTQSLKAGLFVHGFDIPLGQANAFEQAQQRAMRMLSSVNVALIPMATNFRKVMAPHIAWENGFGTAISSCLLMLQGGFSTGLIPSSYSYRTLAFPYGSNIVTDALLGSQAYTIIHDGAEKGRFLKINTLINWPEALNDLRVCWQGEQKDRNCCQCEKCIRTILTFRLTGEKCPNCFEKDVSNAQIRRLRLKGGALDGLTPLVYQAQAQGIKDPWLKATKIAIRRSKQRIVLKQLLKGLIKK